MKRILIFCLFAFGIFLTQHSEAQIVGKILENKAKQAARRAGQKTDEEITDRMNKKIDKAVENAFDSIFNDTEETEAEAETPATGYPSKAATSAMMKSMGISTSPANVAEKYDFSGNIKMIVQTWDDEGNSEGEMDYITYMSESFPGFAMEFVKDGEYSLIIFDMQEGNMIILSESEGNKTGVVMAYAKDSLWNADLDADESDDFSRYNQNLKKTGKSKKIAGYSCDEYIYEDEESAGRAWLTDELPARLWTKMFSSNAIAASKVGYYGGFAMEMDESEKSSDARTFMQVKEVNEKQPRSISTKEYQLMSFGSGAPVE